MEMFRAKYSELNTDTWGDTSRIVIWEAYTVCDGTTAVFGNMGNKEGPGSLGEERPPVLQPGRPC